MINIINLREEEYKFREWAVGKENIRCRYPEVPKYWNILHGKEYYIESTDCIFESLYNMRKLYNEYILSGK